MTLHTSDTSKPMYRDVPSPFDMDDPTFLELAHEMVEDAVRYLQALQTSLVYQPMPEEVRKYLRELPLQSRGLTPAQIYAFFKKYVLPWQRKQNHRRFSAFVDPAATKLSMLAQFWAAVMNNSGSGGDYALVYIEETVVRWLAQLIGFPIEGSDGVLLGGGSDANRHCLEVARFWGARKNGWNVREEGLAGHPRLVLYGTSQIHSCVRKAAFTLGIGDVTFISADQQFRMDPRALRERILADRAVGLLPFCVVVNLGTVISGVVDPIDEIADVCEELGLWLHGDGAFGGLAASVPELAEIYKGIDRLKSIALDPHKWLATGVGCSCVLVREGDLLIDTYQLVPSYLRFQTGKGFAGTRWYSHRSAEQTRPTVRALMTFWNLQQAGHEGAVNHFRRHIDLARYMQKCIIASSDLEVVAAGPLPAVCFRAIPAALRGKESALNDFNRSVMERLQVEGNTFLGGSEIFNADESWDGEEVGGTYALRYCNLNYLLTEDDVEAIIDEVRRVGALCLSEMLLCS